jgi:TonB family protein
MKIVRVIIFVLVNLTSSFALLAQEQLHVLKNVPSNAVQVSIIDVQHLVQTPLYPLLLREEGPLWSLMNGIKSFALSTGSDPARDISYLVLTSNEQGPIMLASGKFDRARIIKYLKSSMEFEELNYNSIPILKFPESAGGMCIALLDENEIAAGNLLPLKTVIDTRAGLKKDILSDPVMSLLIKASTPETVFRSASRSISMLGLFGIPYQVPVRIDPYIKGVVGAVNVSDAVKGEISIITSDEKAASELLRQNWDGTVTWPTSRTPGSNFSMVTASGLESKKQTGPRITLSINFTKKTLDQYWALKNNSGSNPQNSPPTPFLKPMPAYTKEAKDAKVEGTMRIQLAIQKDGMSKDIKILNSLGYGLDESASAFVQDFWRFIPAIRDGEAIDSQLVLDIPFRLGDTRWK